ncbi:MAG: hypothetical protein AAFO91_07810, partial [Bacteroidota bacterium]
LYTYASVFINKSVRYHHTLTEMAKKENYYTSFIHFTKEFMKSQWPNLAQHSMLIARTHKQDPKDSVEVYYEKHIDAHEDTGHPIDESVEAFIDGLCDDRLRKMVRYHDYGDRRTLVDVRNVASKTAQNIKMEEWRQAESKMKNSVQLRLIA